MFDPFQGTRTQTEQSSPMGTELLSRFLAYWIGAGVYELTFDGVDDYVDLGDVAISKMSLSMVVNPMIQTDNVSSVKTLVRVVIYFRY